MAKEMTLKIKGFIVCSTGEEMETPDPPDSLDAAIKLRDEKQAADEYGEEWGVFAEIDV